MNDEQIQEVRQYRAKLEADKKYLREMTELAVQHRMFIVWCVIVGLPVNRMVRMSNIMLEHIKKMRNCLESIEEAVQALEIICGERTT